MSEKNLSRRAAVEISFEGVDITESIRKYLIALSYTDNEEDEADDLQITLQDREGVWMEDWLNQAVDRAASAYVPVTDEEETDTVSVSGGSAVYTVTARSGLNVRKGPGTGYAALATLPNGTAVTVRGFDGGWAAIDYNGATAYVYAAYLLANGESSGSAAAGSESGGAAFNTDEGTGGDPGTGLLIDAVIVRQNWENDGRDELLDCGSFELDSIDCEGPPSVITLKATSLSFRSRIRQTKRSRAWENIQLSGIAAEMARKNGMACLFLSDTDPWYERVEQYKTSDIAFLRWLCGNMGISLKASNKMLVLFDQRAYEQKDAVLTLQKGDGGYLSYRLSVGTADTQYQSCRVSYNNPETGQSLEGVAYIEDYNAQSEDNQQLEITAKVNSIAEALTLAAKHLRLHNKYCRTAEFSLPGNPLLAAGETVTLQGWGGWDGRYIIKQARHEAGSGGYTTGVTLRRVLEGY